MQLRTSVLADNRRRAGDFIAPAVAETPQHEAPSPVVVSATPAGLATMPSLPRVKASAAKTRAGASDCRADQRTRCRHGRLLRPSGGSPPARREEGAAAQHEGAPVASTTRSSRRTELVRERNAELEPRRRRWLRPIGSRARLGGWFFLNRAVQRLTGEIGEKLLHIHHLDAQHNKQSLSL